MIYQFRHSKIIEGRPVLPTARVLLKSVINNRGIQHNLKPIWTGLFANLKRLGGAKWPTPNLAISGQMTMKLGKVILWVEIFTN